MSTNIVLVGAQRRITMMVKLPNHRKPVPITFHPATKEHPNRVNRCPREVWDTLRKKRGSPRQDMAQERSPLEEYLETGLIWEMTPSAANQAIEGKSKVVSPMGPTGAAYRPQPREPRPVPGLEHVAEINQALKEEITLDVPSGTE